MYTVNFHLHAELNYFLPPAKREKFFPVTYKELPSVKHAIEALGVPHVEVDSIQAGSQWVDFQYRVQDGDQIEVHPLSDRNLLNGDPIPLAPPPPDLRFVLDNHLGRLATYLRILGFDSLYRNNFEDKELAAIAQGTQRILLSRDRRLLMRSVVRYGYCLRSLEPEQQLVEVVTRYHLQPHIHPFRRCLRCNHTLEPVPKEIVLHRLMPLTRRYYDDFHICPDCDQVYWRGSHYERMDKIVQRFNKDQF